MQALTHSALLQALGYAIANSLWQMALLWIVFVLVNSLLKLNAAHKYRLAVGAQLLGFVWFAFTLQFYYMQCSEALKQSTEFVSRQHFNLIVPESGNSFSSNLISMMLKGEQLLPYLSVAYLLLLVFLTIKWTRGYNNAQNIRNNGLHKIDIDWKLFVKQIAGQLGIKQDVKIYLSELVSTPMTVGFLKPIILVPLASINHLSAEQMEAVLLHELAHIKRFDYLLNLVLSIVETVLFFNPFTQLISNSIKKERENSCDDWVLQFQYNPSMYAEALLRIAYLQTAPSFAMTLVRKNKNDLLSRVKRMIDNKDARFNYRHQLLALLLMTGILSSIAWFQPIKRHQGTTGNTAETKNKKTLVKEPMLANVANPLFNPVFFLQKPLKKEIAKAVENVKLDMLAAAEEDEIAAQKELATVMPVAAKNLEEINWEEVDKDVQESMKSIDPKVMAGIGIQSDSLSYASAFNYNYGFNNEEFKKGWQQMTIEMKKAGIELEKAFKSKDLLKIKQWQKQQAEINQAFIQLKNMNFSFAPSKTPVLVNGKKSGNESSPIAEQEKSTLDQVKLKQDRALFTSTRNRARLDSIRTRYTTNSKLRPYTQNKLFTAAGEKFEPLARASVSYISTAINNIIPEVVPYTTLSTDSYAYAYDTKDSKPKVKITKHETKKATAASKVNITTTVDNAIDGDTNAKNKRYEIVITDKKGEEKKIIVVVED